jgi:Alpha/beta hydrolase family
MTPRGPGAARHRRGLRALLSLAGLFLAAACATPVGVDPISPQDFERDLTASALSVNKPSRFSDQVLQRFNLAERFRKDPAGALAALQATLAAEGEENRLFALAELSYLHAQHTRTRAYHLAAAAYAFAFLFPGEDQAPPEALDPRARVAADIYNRALTQAFMAPDGTEVVVAGGEHALPFGHLSVDLPRGAPMWAGRRLERFLPASNVAIRGLRNRYRQAGLGAPLVASLGVAENVAPRFSLVPPGIKVPVTIFLRFDGVREGIASGQLRASLELYTQDSADRITVVGREVPLEFEPSAALAYSLNDARIWETEIRGFLRGNYLEHSGGALYTLTPYRPGHVPVVLIHGTASSPARWADLVNELNADPRIAPRVQFWLFTYNTGNPILYSAGLLHEALTRTVGELDPRGTDGALRHMVLIGHSQGGLLAKLMVVDSGTRFWDNVSETPLAQLEVSEETRELLERSLFFKPVPFVDRVVFVATPHHGSSLAGLLIGRFGWLVQWALSLPPNLLRVTGEVLSGSEDPRIRYQLQQGLPRSVDNMSPGHPTIQTLTSLPIAPGVKVHSIIAIRGRGRSLDEAGDGVVSYRSAHVDEVESELIVESGHSVQGNPDAIEEIRRILFEHLRARSLASSR